jgi:uncharacterized protein with PQ loop repeat
MLSLVILSVGSVICLFCAIIQVILWWKSKHIDWFNIFVSFMVLFIYIFQLFKLFTFDGRITKKESLFIPVVAYVYDSDSGDHILQSGNNYYFTVKNKGKTYTIAVDKDVYDKYEVGDYYGE